MYRYYFKRFYDLFFSLILFLLLIPIFLILSIAIKLDSKGPVFYKQKRIGYKGQEFHCMKFRSMVEDADRIGTWYTSKNDSRITKVGSFLRKTSLDELPQVINILKGDMSFVGPRPDVPQQKKQYTDEDYIKRHSVKPGITGLSQAKGRSNLSQEERLKYDLEYVRTCSFSLDINVLIKTAINVLKNKSAW